MRRRARRQDPQPHVVAVVENVPLSADSRLRKQVESLVDAGYRVTVLTRRDVGNAAYRNSPAITVREYPSPPEGSGMLGHVLEYAASLVATSALLLRECLADRVDIVQLCQPPDVYPVLARVVRALGCKVVVDQRDLMPEVYEARFGPPRPWLRWLFRVLARSTYRAADRVVCVNRYLEDAVIANGAEPDGVRIVRNGPRLSRIGLAAADDGLRNGRPHLLCWVGKMGRQDRLDLLVDVADRLARIRHDDWRLAVIGDGECLEETRLAVRRRGLAARVTFTGWIEEAQVFRYLATADLGLDVSLQPEVSPVKVLEYMGAGLATAAFDLPETKAIADGAAELVPPGDVDALATAASTLLDDADARAALGRSGRERISDELAWEHQAIGYLAVMADLADPLSSDSRTLDRSPA